MGDSLVPVSILPTGQHVFYLHPAEGWMQGNTQSHDPKKGYTVKDMKTNEVVKDLINDHVYPINNPAILEEEVNDLLMLSELHESTVLYAVRRRYFEDIVYTNIGTLILALNPFNYTIPWYKDDFMPHYLAEGEIIQKNKPHSWSVAHNTYYEMMNDKQNQCILVSGESGAGKTEAVKIVIKYLAGMTRMKAPNDAEREEQSSVNRRILLASPILESFGNAKTGRNDNSSRFGKFLQVQFDTKGLVRGSVAINYLLERSRVLSAAQGERVYHSFYQVAKGSDAKLYQLEDPKAYPSINSGGTIDNASMDDADGDDLSYVQTNLAFTPCGVAPDDADGIWRTLAGILHAYRCSFKAISDDECVMENENFLKIACDIWMVDFEALKKSLLTTTIEMRGEVTVKKHNQKQSMTARDSLLKSIYKFLFDWMFEKINTTTDGGDKSAFWIGMLDIFGFEDFDVNSFEQLCINLANETLQNHYNDYIFNRDIDECKAEGIDVTSITFIDNKCTVELLNQTKPPGIFALLDEECSLGKGSDLGFLQKIADAYNGKHDSFEKKQLAKTTFIIKHFAGRVSYEVDGFLEKNRDALKDELTLIIRDSKQALLKELLPEPVDRKGRAATCSGIFRTQIGDLMALINSTNPHWIRCVKPHPAKKPMMFSQIAVIEQMRSSGVLETIRIRKAGFPIRIPTADFMVRFRILVANTKVSNDHHEAAAQLLNKVKFDKTMGQVGRTKVFLRAHTYQHLVDLKREALNEYALIAQRFAWRIRGIHRIEEVKQERFKDVIEAMRKQKVERDAVYNAAVELRGSIESQWLAKFNEIMVEENKVSGSLKREVANKRMRTEALDAALAAFEKLRGEEETSVAAIFAAARDEFDELLYAEKRKMDSAERSMFVDAEADVRDDVLDAEEDQWTDIMHWHAADLAEIKALLTEREECARVAREAARVLQYKRRKAQAEYDREMRAQQVIERRIAERASVHGELQAALDTLHGSESAQLRRARDGFEDKRRFVTTFRPGYSVREEAEGSASPRVPRVHAMRPRMATEVHIPARSAHHPAAASIAHSLSPRPRGTDMMQLKATTGPLSPSPSSIRRSIAASRSSVPPRGAFSTLQYSGLYVGHDESVSPRGVRASARGGAGASGTRYSASPARAVAPNDDSTVGLLTSLATLSVAADARRMRTMDATDCVDPYSPHWVPPPDDDSEIDDDELRELEIMEAEEAGNHAYASMQRRQREKQRAPRL